MSGRVKVLVHGPVGLVENVPACELERSVTATGRETADASDSDSGGDGAPATSDAGAPPMARVDCAHERKDRHASLCFASGRSTAQSVLAWPTGAGRLTLGVDGARGVADRAREPVEELARLRCEVAAFETPVVLRGAHANPQWSRVCAVDALKKRSASTCAARYAAICSTGTIVQPQAVSRGHAPFASGL